MAYIRQVASGRWQVSIRKKGEKPLSKTFERKSDAEAWGRMTEGEVERGEWYDKTEADEKSLADVLRDYKTGRGATLKDAEIGKRIDTLIRKNPDMEKLSMSKLGQKFFTTYIESRRKEVSDATVRREIDIFSTAINRAIAGGLPANNPIEKIDRPAPSEARDRRLEPGELERILAAMKPQDRAENGQLSSGCRNLYVRWTVLFAIETAMRQSEILAMRWCNVRFDRHYVHLPATKNGAKRDVPLSRFAERILKIVQKIGNQEREKVFPTTRDALKKAWQRTTVRAGVVDLHFHDLRHEGTSRMSLIYQINELAKVTGHKDLKMLMRYYHPRVDDLVSKLRG